MHFQALKVPLLYTIYRYTDENIRATPFFLHLTCIPTALFANCLVEQRPPLSAFQFFVTKSLWVINLIVNCLCVCRVTNNSLYFAICRILCSISHGHTLPPCSAEQIRVPCGPMGSYPNFFSELSIFLIPTNFFVTGPLVLGQRPRRRWVTKH